MRRKQVITALRRARAIHQEWTRADVRGKVGRIAGRRAWHVYWTGVYTAALRELGAE